MPYPKGLPIFTIWNEIAFHLVSPKDLVSLALTCRDFKELVIPDHLEYRYISCDIRQNDVWKHLESRPRLNRGVQFVKLLSGPLGDVCLPRALQETVIPFNRSPSDPPFTDEDVASFKESLSRMIFLKELTLIQPYSISSEPPFIDAFLDILTSSTASSLEGLSVKLIPHVFLDDEMVSPRYGQISTWPLIHLKRIILCDSIQAAIQLILFCPDIEDLFLSELSSASTSHLMTHANWKKLRRLSLTFRALAMPAEDFSAIMTSFFQRHGSIESLYLVLRSKLVVNLSSSHLPKLRSVTMFSTVNDFSVTSFLPAESISRLEHFDCPITNTDIDALERMDNLRSFRLAQFNSISLEKFTSFLLKAPNLEKLCLDTFLVSSFWPDVAVEVKLVHIFLQCSNLTHIFCDFSLSGASEAGCNQPLEDLCQSLSPLQALNYLQVRLDCERKYFKLETDGDGYYSKYHSVTLKEIGGEPRYWGDVFLHL